MKRNEKMGKSDSPEKTKQIRQNAQKQNEDPSAPGFDKRTDGPNRPAD